MLTNCLAACTHLSLTVSQLFQPQVQRIAVFTRDLRIGNFRSNRISNRRLRFEFESNLESNRWIVVYSAVIIICYRPTDRVEIDRTSLIARYSTMSTSHFTNVQTPQLVRAKGMLYRKCYICCFRGVIMSPYNCRQTSMEVQTLQELSNRQQVACQLRTQYAEGTHRRVVD